MDASASSPRHLLRWIALGIFAVLVALVLALAIHIYNLLQPQRFTTLLENALATAGLALRMQASAEPTLFPRPGVKLEDFSLTNIGSNTPVLRADGATIVVPWRALLHSEIAIERVDVDAPHVDLDELESLLARLPHHVGPPRLPTISTGVHMNHGMLTRKGSPLLFDFSVETGALAPGQVFHLDASARSAAGRRLSATLTTVPSTAHDGVIDFEALHLGLAEQQGTALQLDGHASWRGGETVAVHLQGTWHHRALTPPPSASASTLATSAPAQQDVNAKIALDVSPARGHAPMTVALKLNDDDAHADLHLQPTEFGHWWKQLLAAKPGQAPPVALPFTGHAEIQQLDLGWIKAKGLRIDADPDLSPAASVKAAAVPAASAAH